MTEGDFISNATTTVVVGMEDYSFISSLASKAVEEAKKKKKQTSVTQEAKEVVDLPPSYLVCGNLGIGKWGEEVNTPTLTPPTPPKMGMSTSPLVEQIPPSPIINSSRRAGARRLLKRQEKRKSQENAEGGSSRTGVEKLVGIRTVGGAENQEGLREKLATNCDGNRVDQKCDIAENNSDQSCSQSLLNKQSDDDIKAEHGEGDGEAGEAPFTQTGEARQVIEDQVSLEEWGEDDLQVG